MPIQALDMFGGLGRLKPKELSARYEAYVEAMNNAPHTTLDKAMWATAAPHKSGVAFGQDLFSGRPTTPMELLTKTLARDDIVKTMSPDALASIVQMLETQKAQIPDLTKDLTTSSPVSTGLVVFDLETGAKMLTPRPTPLRNRIPRSRGYGLAHRFKRITGFTGTGTGNVGIIRPGIQDSTQTNFANPGSSNNLFFNRGGKISYAGDEFVVPYIQFGVSDELSWSTQFSAQGFQDVRALSRNSVTWASMLLEERVLLYGRGTGSGYAGTFAAPTGVAGAARAAVAGETGISGATTNVFVRVIALLGDFGVSQASAATGAIAVTNGQVVDVTFTLPAGSTGAMLFVSTGAGDPGDASRWLYTFTGGDISYGTGGVGTGAFVQNGKSGYGKITIQGALPTSGTVPTAWPSTGQGGGTINLTTTDGGSAVANEYDGIWTYASGANSGYVKALNAQFSNTNPGSEYQIAFSSLYDSVKASPDRILMNGNDRRQLSDTIKGSANSNYGIRLMRDDINGVTLGTVAVSILNETVGDKEVTLEVHPWLPQGNSPILSDTLPIPDSQVSNVFEVFNVQDLMGIDWPVNQFSYDTSSYWFGAMVCYAPAWLGALTNIRRA